MKTFRRPALAFLCALALAGCGGGGGGAADAGGGAPGPASGFGGTGSGPSTSDPFAPPSGAGPSTPPAAQPFSAFGPLRVASAASHAHGPQVARLAGGGNVVLWVQDTQLMARFTDAAGAATGDPFVVNPGDTRTPGPFSVAPAPDGGFVVVRAMETGQAMSPTHAVTALQAQRFSPDGRLVWEHRVHDGLVHSIDSPVVKPTSDGAFAVGWVSRAVSAAPAQGFLQRLAADGTRVGPLAAVNAIDEAQEQLALAPLQDGTVLAVWRQVQFGSRGGAHWIYARRFDSASQPLMAATAVDVRFHLPATRPFVLDADTLANGHVGLAWGGTDAVGGEAVHAAILSPDGALASTAETWSVEWPVSAVAVLPAGSAGFRAAWQMIRGGSREMVAMIWTRTFDNAGAATGAPQQLMSRLTYWVSPTTGFFVDAGVGLDLFGGPDGHFIGAFHQADEEQPNTYLFGR